MTPFIDDPDFTLHVGDVTDVLRQLPDESVHCVVTSPPYWGLRDYGTGQWDGGDPDCDHRGSSQPQAKDKLPPSLEGRGQRDGNHGDLYTRERANPSRECVDCGARRVDQQLGLEPTPDAYVTRMVEVFREVKRVLRSDGTLFLNIGDSYASSALSVQQVRSDDSRARSGQGDVSEVLSPDGTTPMERGTPRAGAGEGASVPPEAQGSPERTDHSAPSGHEGQDHRDAGRQVQLLRGDGAGVSDDRPRSERWEQGAQDDAPSALQDDPGRGMPDGPLPDPLLELQLSQGDSRSVSPFGNLKQKDLVGIPWMLAFALRADGWYLRSDIIWVKPNPMPESVTDRPTKAHEYLFLLTKSARYFYDADAIRESYGDPAREWWSEARTAPGNPDRKDGGGIMARPARGPDGRKVTPIVGQDGSEQHRNGERWPNLSGRNARSVWEIPTQPYAEAHFATFPEELARRCIAAGTSERGCCPECGAPWERITETTYEPSNDGGKRGRVSDGYDKRGHHNEGVGDRARRIDTTVGWAPACKCGEWPPTNPIPCVVLDPFVGSGTTALVARKLGRHSIGIELSPEYAALCAKRLNQLSLFAG